MNEVVPQHLRGGLVDIHAVMLIFGYTVQGWVDSASTSGKPVAQTHGVHQSLSNAPGLYSFSWVFTGSPNLQGG